MMEDINPLVRIAEALEKIADHLTHDVQIKAAIQRLRDKTGGATRN